MKRCHACSCDYESVLASCPKCGVAPGQIEGFQAWSPECAYGGGGFKPESFQGLARLEASNFWFRARNRLILWALRRYASDFSSLLEIGCGTGFVLSGIAASHPSAKLMGSEIFVAGLSYAAKRVPTAELVQMDARRIPYSREFDTIGAFDVLEHIKEDESVLREAHRALKDQGTLILTVPQHPWLWSSVDDFSHHERRYTAAEIHEKLKNSGFEILRSTSFVSMLLPAMLLSRLFSRRSAEDIDPAKELEINPIVNVIFERLMDVELVGIKIGLNYVFGGSRLIISRKSLRPESRAS